MTKSKILTTATFLVVFPALVPAAEPQEFFQTFATATSNFEQGKSREAAAALQAAGQKFITTPWKEIALLKAAEMEESFDRVTASKNYSEIVNRLKDQGSDRACQVALAQASRGLQRLEASEIEAALQKYYLAKVEFPASLEILVQAKYLTDDKIRDSSGKTYAYSTGVEKLIPSVPRQTYTLQKAVSSPFGWKDAKIVGMTAGAALVQWTSAPSKSLRVGDKADDLEVLSVLDSGVILGNDSRLVVLSAK
ncbi:MAG: hypothetical protein EXS18_04170 [Verrucomicrobiae bacterium]|nr:hypothetical protein [Verrucomicrobiae bacterium]